MNWEGFLEKSKQYTVSSYFINKQLNIPWFMTISKEFFPLAHHIIADYLKTGIPTSYINSFKGFFPPSKKVWTSKE